MNEQVKTVIDQIEQMTDRLRDALTTKFSKSGIAEAAFLRQADQIDAWEKKAIAAAQVEFGEEP